MNRARNTSNFVFILHLFLMKNFKLGLFGIVLVLFGLTCFSYGYNKGDATRIYLGKSLDQTLTGGYCVVGDSNYNSCQYTYVSTNSGNITLGGKVFCNDNETKTIHNGGTNSCAIFIFDGSILNNDCPVCEECEECQECQQCPAVDTGAILSGYIAISDITTNYCVSNDLCPEMSGGNSALFINDIRHESMPFINLRIPEEIERTYNYTGNGTQLDISVEGYGYDQEKMQNMVNTQYYTPTSEEMSNLVGKIADFLPLIAIALLIVRIRRVLKKVFRF